MLSIAENGQEQSFANLLNQDNYSLQQRQKTLLRRGFLTRCLCRSAEAITSGTGTYVHHPHHLVIFVREDMAVPHVTPGLVESRLDSGDLPW